MHTYRTQIEMLHMNRIKKTPYAKKPYEKRLGAINVKTRLVGPCLLVLEIWPLVAL